MSRIGTWALLGLLLSFVSSPAAESQLTTGGSDLRPAWSPDGATIVFDSNRDGNRDLWSIPASGGTATQLTTSIELDQHADWSPSSTRIVFSAVVGGGQPDLYEIPAAGGAPVLLFEDVGTNDRFPSWSPDSAQIAYSRDSDIYIMPAGGGAPTQLTTDPADDLHPSWSPDGTQIVFLSNRSGNNDLWIISSTGGVATQLTTNTANDGAPDWSPDGSHIAFQSNRGATGNDVWVIPSTGGTAIQITTTAGNDVQPDWSPTSGEIVFARGNNLWKFTFPASDLGVTKTVDQAEPFEGDTITYTVTVTNDGPEAATNVEVADLLPAGVTYQSHLDTQGTYTPGIGEWIVGDLADAQSETLTITATVDAGTAGTTIGNTATVSSVLYHDSNSANDSSTADVEVQIQLDVKEKPLTTRGTDQHPAWSPDGDVVAFDSNRSGTRALWTVPATGGVPALLNSNLASSRQPDWSPMSDLIVFSGHNGGGPTGVDPDLYTLQVSGESDPGSHGSLTLIQSESTNDVSPAFSPDGTTIAYSKGTDIYVVPSTGGAPTQLTTNAAVDAHPTWSPDGSQIAFASGRGGNDDIWIIPSTGGAATQLTTGPSDDGAPDWSPIGNWIAFHSNRSGTNDIWVVPPSGGQPSRVTQDAGSDVEPDWAPNGTQLVFSRDGSLWVAALPEAPPSPQEIAASAGVQIRTRQTWIDSVTPNPGRAPQIRWDLRQAGHAELAIYDATGRLVQRLVSDDMQPGPHITAWDGRDRAGRPVPSGVYFAKLQVAGWRDAAKVIVVR